MQALAKALGAAALASFWALGPSSQSQYHWRMSQAYYSINLVQKSLNLGAN